MQVDDFSFLQLTVVVVMFAGVLLYQPMKRCWA
jgi:hypothetical protein